MSEAADGRTPVGYESVGYYRVRAPTVRTEGPAPAVVALHGYAQPPEEMLEYAASVAPPEAVLVAPEGPSSFYRPERAGRRAERGAVDFGWAADPRREATDRRNTALILAAIEDAGRAVGIDPGRTVVLGYSQGVGVGAHFAASHPDRLGALVGLAGGVRMEVRPRLAGLGGRPLLWVGGERDRFYPPAYLGALVAELRGEGLRVDALRFRCGHGILDPAASAVRDWIHRFLAGTVPGR